MIAFLAFSLMFAQLIARALVANTEYRWAQV